jgi:hypothetical protein
VAAAASELQVLWLEPLPKLLAGVSKSERSETMTECMRAAGEVALQLRLPRGVVGSGGDAGRSSIPCQLCGDWAMRSSLTLANSCSAVLTQGSDCRVLGCSSRPGPQGGATSTTSSSSSLSLTTRLDRQFVRLTLRARHRLVGESMPRRLVPNLLERSKQPRGLNPWAQAR